jgi:hypothetical protein
VTEVKTGEKVPVDVERMLHERPAQPMISNRGAGADVLPSYEVEAVDVDYALMLTKFEERAKFVAGVRKVAVQQTRHQDWLARKQKNGSVNYDLMGPGCERIKSVCPIGFQNVKQWEEKWTKESGPGYTVYFQGEVYLGSPRTGPLPVMGSCSSDDDFFSTEYLELTYNEGNPEHQQYIGSGEGNLSSDGKTLHVRRQIAAADVTKENIVKSALTNLVVNGVTRVLGIRKMNSDDLKGYGVDVDKIGGFEYGSGKAKGGQLSPALEQKREELWKWLVELHGGDVEKAKANLIEMTKFNDYAGQGDYKRLTEKQVERQHGGIKARYDKFRGDNPAEKPPAGQQRATGKGPAAGAPAKGAPAAGGDKPKEGGDQPELL